jgi:hypothetical protein
MISGLEKRAKTTVLDHFRNIVGSIVVLETPLSTRSLARLLWVPLSQVISIQYMVHSALTVPATVDIPVITFHLSFRDFLLHQNETENSPFRVNEMEAHEHLARHCLRITRKSLRVNILNIRNPGTPMTSIDGNLIKDKVPPEVQYAYRFWPHHLVRAAVTISDEDEVHTFLTLHLSH